MRKEGGGGREESTGSCFDREKGIVGMIERECDKFKKKKKNPKQTNKQVKGRECE